MGLLLHYNICSVNNELVDSFESLGLYSLFYEFINENLKKSNVIGFQYIHGTYSDNLPGIPSYIFINLNI